MAFDIRKVKIDTSAPFSLKVGIRAEKPGVVRITVWEKTRPHTVYSDRRVGSATSPVRGSDTVFFAFPVMPGKVGIRVIGAKLLSTQAVPMPKAVGREAQNAELDGFLTFAGELAHHLGNVPVGTYAPDNGSFTVRLLPAIRDHATGLVLSTAARGSLQTRLIEVCRPDFLHMSVPNRLSVLLHEYGHSGLGMEDETACDLFAAKTMLGMGYDKIETVYALSKLFLHNTDIKPALRLEQERRVATVSRFITGYNRPMPEYARPMPKTATARKSTF